MCKAPGTNVLSFLVLLITQPLPLDPPAVTGHPERVRLVSLFFTQLSLAQVLASRLVSLGCLSSPSKPICCLAFSMESGCKVHSSL